MGAPLPSASAEQLETFERGRQVALKRFDLEDGLGPAFNVTFCGSCHERPVTGGSAGLYRNFFIAGTTLSDGSFVFSPSAGEGGGVVRMYYHGDEHPARPAGVPQTNTIAQRNPIPFFGVGLLAELPESAILRHADEFDRNGDGISGRPNYDQGFVGRFGRKAQTVSIEGFIRGPLFNHLGITTDPLSEEQKAALPVDSSSQQAFLLAPQLNALRAFAQAAAPAAPLTDQDAAPDPEMSTDELFDLVSFAMLLAAPEFDPPTPQTERGEVVFDAIGCASCHTPRLHGPRGPIPAYSDLLLHDMGPEMADGLIMGLATASEFRTQPLWGLSAIGPYLHDGRAETISDAILHHGGEASGARDRFAALDEAATADLLAFLNALGGSKQYSPGLIPPNTPVPAVGEYGGPSRPLSDAEATQFAGGRALFDKEFGYRSGLGQPRFNGDSCRACHFDPVVGGSGPRGVNVMRHAIFNDDGDFVLPSVGSILHKQTILSGHTNDPQDAANLFEMRQTPHLFGLGLIESIPEEAILANADPDDTLSVDGISGKPSYSEGGQFSRFGWKAQVPSLAEFVRDAVFVELGMTLPYVEGLNFGRIHDNDDVPDPEMSLADAELLEFYLATLAGPPRQTVQQGELATVARGEEVFDEVGCAACHIPSLPGADGPVPLYSDLLLHAMRDEILGGIEEASAEVHEFRTAPLWGLSQTAPYLHDGRADTIAQAIEGHAGEAQAVRDGYLTLSDEDRVALLAFLETL